jgi:hypothetical protein
VLSNPKYDITTYNLFIYTSGQTPCYMTRASLSTVLLCVPTTLTVHFVCTHNQTVSETPVAGSNDWTQGFTCPCLQPKWRKHRKKRTLDRTSESQRLPPLNVQQLLKRIKVSNHGEVPYYWDGQIKLIPEHCTCPAARALGHVHFMIYAMHCIHCILIPFDFCH